ncbi:hypothetical protein [Aliikangiella sp. IMCC44359]|uniref:hypothetical protein n=1 Tax=Aliikangiella sp. IMCC44359 TaxID=3459125 RepID=UPI00403B2EF9
MKLSITDLFNRVIYVGFGLLLGLQIVQLWQTPDEVLASHDNATIESDSANSNGGIENTEFKLFLERVIREEIQLQLAHNTVPKTSVLQTEKSTSASQNLISEESANKTFEQQRLSFQKADELISNAIDSNHWNTDSAQQLISHLSQLTPAQELAIRTKYANAVNEGFITPDMPLELIGAIEN